MQIYDRFSFSCFGKMGLNTPKWLLFLDAKPLR